VSAGRYVMRPLIVERLVGLLSALCFLAPTGCAIGAAEGPKAKPRRVAPRDTRLVHEDCPVSGAGAGTEDVNGDGRPDRRTHSEGARLACATLDFNFDGVVDAWMFLDEAGKVRRRENDYDHDGNADEIALYSAGVLVEQQRSTVHTGKLDTWHYFSGGKLSRSERDANGDDYIDQWWEYPESRSRDCPLIHSDVDGDGRPDPGATVDVCGGSGAAGTETETLDAPPTGISEAPTEVKAAETAAPGGAGGAGGAATGGGTGSPPRKSPGGSP
jgi:hypothetical protein